VESTKQGSEEAGAHYFDRTDLRTTEASYESYAIALVSFGK
jgi:hypothetical protein